MDDQHERIEKKLDAVVEDIGEIRITLAEQHIVLKEHIRRTALLEQDLAQHKQMNEHMHGKFQSYMDKQQGMLKLGVALVGIPAVLYYVISIFNFFIH